MSEDFISHSSSNQVFTQVSVKNCGMDRHRQERSRRLRAWIDSKGGPTACLVALGIEKKSDAFRKKQSWISTATNLDKGLGHTGAVGFEEEFAMLGMAPGFLTNNLDDIGGPGSLPPGHVTEDMQLTKLFSYSLADLGRIAPTAGLISTTAADDLPPLFLKGYEIVINMAMRDAQDGSVALVRTAGAKALLGLVRVTVNGYEVDIGRGMALEQAKHGLQILGTAVVAKRSLLP